MRVSLINVLELRLGSYNLKDTILKYLINTNCCKLRNEVDLILHLSDKEFIIFLLIL